ncbi:hypothetical protein N7454_009294 [Penicillium verhagenii]|nr:hypothetical protein N7454_009294 [Penicillium verhagenii]
MQLDLRGNDMSEFNVGLLGMARQPAISNLTTLKPEECMAAMKKANDMGIRSVTFQSWIAPQTPNTWSGNCDHSSDISVNWCSLKYRMARREPLTSLSIMSGRCFLADEDLLGSEGTPAHRVHSDFGIPRAICML